MVARAGGAERGLEGLAGARGPGPRPGLELGPAGPARVELGRAGRWRWAIWAAPRALRTALASCVGGGIAQHDGGARPRARRRRQHLPDEGPEGRGAGGGGDAHAGDHPRARQAAEGGEPLPMTPRDRAVRPPALRRPPARPRGRARPGPAPRPGGFFAHRPGARPGARPGVAPLTRSPAHPHARALGQPRGVPGQRRRVRPLRPLLPPQLARGRAVRPRRWAAARRLGRAPALGPRPPLPAGERRPADPEQGGDPGTAQPAWRAGAPRPRAEVRRAGS
jgi:hypothetical protein